MKKIFVYTLMLGCWLVACKKNDSPVITPAMVNNAASIYPAPPAKWFGGAKPYYSPAGFVGDVMPYYEKDSFHVFYLHDARDGASGFHPWSKFTTSNLVSYQYDGVMIPYGGTSDQDLALGTGSIVKAGSTYYAYYSGFNPNFSGSGGKFRDVTLLATSKDLNSWQKVPGFIIKPETANGYDFHEYRDPYVFYNAEKNQYWMLVGGRKDSKAVVMLYTSSDPATGSWQLQNPLYTDAAYYIPETPQLLKWGNVWYLFFSENSVENVTRYRMATSSAGPWTTPVNDKLDGQYMYASKVASDGTNTYLFGWCPTKGGSSDQGNRDFGGNLVVHQLMQNSDGTLKVGLPANIEKSFTRNEPLNLVLKQKDIQFENNAASFKNNPQEAVVLFDRITGKHKITATISNIVPGAEFGFVFGMDKAIQNTNYYKLNFNESNDLLSGLRIGNNSPSTDGKVNLVLEAGKDYEVTIIIDGSVCVVYVNNQVALTSRIYALNNNQWGLYASKGNIIFKNIQLTGL